MLWLGGALDWAVALSGFRRSNETKYGILHRMSASFTYWQEPSGFWLGYWNDYPEHTTQGHTLTELKDMLVSLRTDIREMIAEGILPDTHKEVGELAYA